MSSLVSFVFFFSSKCIKSKLVVRIKEIPERWMNRLEPNLVGDGYSNMQSIIACTSWIADLKFNGVSVQATLKLTNVGPNNFMPHIASDELWCMMRLVKYFEYNVSGCDFIEHIRDGMNIESIGNDVHKLCVQDRELYVMFVDLMANFDVCKRKEINEYFLCGIFGAFSLCSVQIRCPSAWYQFLTWRAQRKLCQNYIQSFQYR